MKKILFLAVALVMSVCSMWAGSVERVNDFTGYSPAPVGSEWAPGTKWFMIQNLHSNGTTKFYLTPSDNYLPQTLPTASNIDSYLWAFIGDAENGFKLYNKAEGTSKILWASSSTRGMSESPTQSHVWDLYTSLAAGKYLFIEHGTDHNAFNNGAQEGRLVTWDSEGALYGWNHTASNPTATGDDGSNFIISGAEDFTIVVNGLVGEGGVVIAGENYSAGTVSTFTVLAEAATPIPVDGYDAELNVSGTTITVTYTAHVSNFPDAGTYFVTFKGQKSDRYNCLYNDLTQGEGYTFQSQNFPTPIAEHNNYIWKVVSNGNGRLTSMTNGQGGSYAMQVNSDGKKPQIQSLDYEAHTLNGKQCYYLKITSDSYVSGSPVIKSGHNCLNVANSNFMYNGFYTVTTWDYTKESGNAGDNNWEVSAIDMTGLNEYTVSISGKDDVYVTYNGQYAANGGFFLAASIVEGDLTTPDCTGFDKTVTVIGTAITVEYVQTQPDWAGLEAIVAEAEAIPYGDKLGQYSNPSFASELGEAQMMLTMHAGGIHASIEAVDEAISNLRTAIDGLTLNMPQPNTFLRMKGVVNTANYLTSGTSNGKYSMGSDAKESIFFYDGEHLLNYSTGLYAGVTSSSWAWTAAGGVGSNIGFTDCSTKCAYLITIPGTNTYTCLYSGASGATNADRGAMASKTTDTKYHWYLEEVTTLPVTFKAAGEGYATLYSPVALEIPTDIIAYYGTEESEGTVKVSPIEGGIIPANTGVVLYKEGVTETTTVDFTITTGGTATSSCFTGTVPAKASEEGTYVFSIANENAGFYKFGGATLAGFKAYYKPEVASVQGFVLDFGGQTVGIEGLQTAAPVKGAFDLQGRRVNAATRGLFIQNGVKVIR